MSDPTPNDSNHLEATDRAVAVGGDGVDSTIMMGDLTALASHQGLEEVIDGKNENHQAQNFF